MGHDVIIYLVAVYSPDASLFIRDLVLGIASTVMWQYLNETLLLRWLICDMKKTDNTLEFIYLLRNTNIS
jgi:hypothetical protein